jgi:hypothetical protein
MPVSPLSSYGDILLTICAEYDQIPAGTLTKENHYVEAAMNLNKADSALQASGAGQEDEPVSLLMGQGDCRRFEDLGHI